MNQQETEQFGALRMHLAHLHNALKNARESLVRGGVRTMTVGERPDMSALEEIDQALDQSEPEVKALLAEADRDAKLVACRQTLAQVTSRLGKIEGTAHGVVSTLYAIDPERDPLPAGVRESVDALAEALK